jgi:3-methylfumaryl-CoA hydratase
MTLDPADVAHWRSWIGRTERRTEIIETESVRRFAAALGEPLDVEQALPSLAHWACFLPVVEPGAIGPDGHPRRGGFLPPVSLPRRMFAAAEMRFGAALVLGAEAVRTSEVAAVTHKAGRSGDLMLVEVDHRITQGEAMCVEERQTLVYRGEGGVTPGIGPAAVLPAGECWRPGPVDLFRFSAATFNSHRIHYDEAYAREEEGYPGLVVHGPFTAARLFGLARRQGPVRRFAFRAQAPLFLGQPIVLRAAGSGQYEAVRCDGTVAMTATAES